MSRIERITRTTRGPQSIPRADRAPAVDRVGPRPDRDPHEREDAQPGPDGRPARHTDADGHVDVRA